MNGKDIPIRVTTGSAGAGPKTELLKPGLAGAGAGSGEYESDTAGAYQAHMLDRPGSETGPGGLELDRMSPSRTEWMLHTRRPGAEQHPRLSN